MVTRVQPIEPFSIDACRASQEVSSNVLTTRSRHADGGASQSGASLDAARGAETSDTRFASQGDVQNLRMFYSKAMVKAWGSARS
jgi:hypothetical protein